MLSIRSELVWRRAFEDMSMRCRGRGSKSSKVLVVVLGSCNEMGGRYSQALDWFDLFVILSKGSLFDSCKGACFLR